MSEYKKIVTEQISKVLDLSAERDRIDEQIEHLRQLIEAAMNLMPEEERAPYMTTLARIVHKREGLTAEIRAILKGNRGSFTATDIKEALDKKGYDFSNYTSNPLSSIYAVLKRFKRTEVERTYGHDSEEVGYHWIGKRGK